MLIKILILLKLLSLTSETPTKRTEDASSITNPIKPKKLKTESKGNFGLSINLDMLSRIVKNMNKFKMNQHLNSLLDFDSEEVLTSRKLRFKIRNDESELYYNKLRSLDEFFSVLSKVYDDLDDEINDDFILIVKACISEASAENKMKGCCFISWLRNFFVTFDSVTNDSTNLKAAILDSLLIYQNDINNINKKYPSIVRKSIEMLKNSSFFDYKNKETIKRKNEALIKSFERKNYIFASEQISLLKIQSESLDDEDRLIFYVMLNILYLNNILKLENEIISNPRLPQSLQRNNFNYVINCVFFFFFFSFFNLKSQVDIKIKDIWDIFVLKMIHDNFGNREFETKITEFSLEFVECFEKEFDESAFCFVNTLNNKNEDDFENFYSYFADKIDEFLEE